MKFHSSTFVALLAVIGLSFSGAAFGNVNPGGSSGCGEATGHCECESEDGTVSVTKASSEEECSLASCKWVPGSLEWSLNLGFTRWTPYTDLFSLYSGNVADPGFYKPGGYATRAQATHVYKERYRPKQAKTQRYPVQMHFSVFNIMDATDPRSLRLPVSAKVQIDYGPNIQNFLKSSPYQLHVEPNPPAVGSVYASIVSDTFLTEVVYTTDGYEINIFSRVDPGNPKVRVFRFRRVSSTEASNGMKVNVMEMDDIQNPDVSPVTRTTRFVETTDEGTHVSLVVTSYLEGQDWRRQTVNYSDVVGGDSGDTWPDTWTAERVIEERADTATGGNSGAYKVIEHNIEKYEQFRRIATPQKNTSEPNEDGIVMPVIIPATYEPKSHATRRLIELTTGVGSSAPRTKKFQYYGYSDPNTVQSDGYTNPYIFGRIKSAEYSDGSWLYYEYTGSTTSPTSSTTKYSPYKNVGLDDKENARKEVEEVFGSTITRNVYLAGTLVERMEIIETPDEDGSKTITESVWTGADWNTENGKLSTVTAYHDDNLGDANKAGRPKWKKHSDGTYSVYSYAGGSNGSYTITVDSGAGSSAGINDGTRTATTYNSAREETEQVVSGITAGTAIQMSSWSAQTFDPIGRPTEIQHNGNSNDKTIKEYSCCGLSLLVDRSGSRTEYSHSPSRRVYKTVVKRSDSGTPVTTLSLKDGLVTTTSIAENSYERLVFRTTRALNGDLETSLTPNPTQPESGVLATALSNAVTTTYAYTYPAGGTGNGPGVTTTTTMPDGSTSIRETFKDGRIKSISGTAVADADYTYGIHSENGGGEKTTVSYGGTSQTTTSYTDPLGRTFKTQYDTGVTSTMTYNPSTAAAGARGKLASSTDPDSITTTYAYNAEGERTTTTQQTAGGTRITSTETDAVGNAESGIGNAWCTVSTVEGQGATNAVPEVTVSTSYRSGDGYQSKSVSLSGTSTSTRSVASNGAWTVTSTNPDGTSSITTYSDGLMASSEIKDSANATVASSSRSYDAFGRLLTTVDSRTGTSSINSYTENGQPLSVTATDSTTTSFTYDIMGRRIQVDAPDTLDADGNTLANITNTSYYPTGQVKATWGAQTYPRFHLYDEQNRLIELRTYQDLAFGTEPQAATTGFAKTNWIYNAARGWLNRKQYDDGKGTNYTYTDAGRLATRTWARGVATTYAYTAGQLNSVTYSDATPTVSYAYDSLGRVLNADNTVSNNSYTYDVANLTLDSESVTTGGVTRTLDRSYDVLLRSSGMTVSVISSPPGGTPQIENSTTYAYDTAGRLSTVTGNGDTFTYAYQSNSYGLVQSVTGPAHTVTNIWESNRNALATKTNADLASTPVTVSAYDYSVNAIGQRGSVDTSGTAFGADQRDRTWGYDALGQVTKEDDTNNVAFDRGFAYDAIGNRTSSRKGTTDPNAPGASSYEANSLNQYSEVMVGSADDPNYNNTGPIAVTISPETEYDNDGNLTRDAGVNNRSSYFGRTYVWDAENRLTEVKEGTTTIAEFAYDCLGRRVRKTTASEDTVFLYDGWNVVAEYQLITAQWSLTTAYTWGMDLSGSMQGAGGVSGLLAVHEVTGFDPNNGSPISDPFFPTYDGNGNVSEYLDASGANVAHYEYDAFGNVVKVTGTSSNFRYRFSTKPLDEEIGWYYYGYRYYDPITGRWPSRDPIEEQGGINLYGFVGNDGVNAWDVLGLKKFKARSGTCKIGDSCAKNAKRLAEWSREAAERWQEAVDPKWIQAAIDNVPFKPGEYPTNPNVKTPRQAYRNHLDKLAVANGHALNCAAILKVQQALGLCLCPDPEKVLDWADGIFRKISDALDDMPRMPIEPVPLPQLPPNQPVEPKPFVYDPNYPDWEPTPFNSDEVLIGIFAGAAIKTAQGIKWGAGAVWGWVAATE